VRPSPATIARTSHDRDEASSPQILLATMWIACAYRDQMLDPKDFLRAVMNCARRARAPFAHLSTVFVGKHVDILRICDVSG
jgi:hypothetical protein